MHSTADRLHLRQTKCIGVGRCRRMVYQAVHQLLGAAERGQTVQMWTRLGYGPAIGPAPRRGLEAHVRKA